MNFVLWMVTTAPLTRSTRGATEPDSTPVMAAPGGGTAQAGAANRNAAAKALTAVDDNAARGVIGRERHGDLIAQNDADSVLAELAPEVGEHLMAVLELDSKISSG